MTKLLISLLLFSNLVLAADQPGSQDLPVLPRFPHAQIVYSVSTPDAERTYPQSAIRRISNQLRIEQPVEVAGLLTALTYQLPAGHAASEAFSAARKALLAGGAEPLYWCEGRDCGSSSQWANAIFGNAQLYGPDDQQAYLLVRLASPRHNSLLALYGITRGNRRAYLHVEQLDSSSSIAELLPTPATLLRELKSSAVLRLPGLPQVPDARWVEVLARTLKLDSTLPVTLSGAGAAAWREALLGQGINASRLLPGDSTAAGLQLEIRR
ncbi:DUF4892 domain-containing protein [Pseudomonas sp. N040]|uniref:DUF4892 domain-containing protein n=1 Tax=Pseudomonas sp. N040 TaxID=2785325 RepID=UPI0018A30648|nr:DUF4892 domain-containing protein [Pseudomonas sp. N040]MBF7729472.1 DUF4892 domain-containing protein [Pseudomonas sp. N040]MBW7013112.1 DUF4892 domain-containing protein [Pseudomonas sp. N040]